ncbi:MAG: YciI family protein [Wenzhouxiangella sp.]|jgi:uncharacterized protein YciI|nr:YciI family protein [Wenzhouxiangella sp.]
MRIFLALGLLAALLPATAASANDTGPAFDAELAERLGADNYGMRIYVLVMLEPGEARIDDAERLAEIQQGHMAHIRTLAAAGQLVLAGPVLDAEDLRGIFILAVDDLEQARALVAEDPAVKAGRLQMRLLRWYGSAALPELAELHARIARQSP